MCAKTLEIIQIGFGYSLIEILRTNNGIFLKERNLENVSHNLTSEKILQRNKELLTDYTKVILFQIINTNLCKIKYYLKIYVLKNKNKLFFIIPFKKLFMFLLKKVIR